jgi:hypothetical protein
MNDFIRWKSPLVPFDGLMSHAWAARRIGTLRPWFWATKNDRGGSPIGYSWQPFFPCASWAPSKAQEASPIDTMRVDCRKPNTRHGHKDAKATIPRLGSCARVLPWLANRSEQADAVLGLPCNSHPWDGRRGETCSPWKTVQN